MGAELVTTGRQEVKVHYVNAGIPAIVEENFNGNYVEQDDLSLEAVLQDQESVYQSLQTKAGNDVTRASTSAGSSSDPDQSSSLRTMERGGESSSANDPESQLALDEALARALQDLENQCDIACLSDTGSDDDITPSHSSPVNTESSSAGTTALAAGEDNIDPDNMTYEGLQSLGEAIGTESRGLSEELIAYLPTVKYKTSFFSKKGKHEEQLKFTDKQLLTCHHLSNFDTQFREVLEFRCVICYMVYKNRDTLITLPCQHQYHSSCITRWLKLNKACPICNEEVFG